MQFLRNEAPSNAALWPITFACKSLTSTETWYSNTEKEALDILHGLKIYHYCFIHEVIVITRLKTIGGNIEKRCSKLVT